MAPKRSSPQRTEQSTAKRPKLSHDHSTSPEPEAGLSDATFEVTLQGDDVSPRVSHGGEQVDDGIPDWADDPNVPTTYIGEGPGDAFAHIDYALMKKEMDAAALLPLPDDDDDDEDEVEHEDERAEQEGHGEGSGEGESNEVEEDDVPIVQDSCSGSSGHQGPTDEEMDKHKVETERAALLPLFDETTKEGVTPSDKANYDCQEKLEYA